MKLVAVATRHFSSSRTRVFDLICSTDSLTAFTGRPPIPATVSARTEDDGPLRQGGVRIATLADGTQVREDIVELVDNECQAYRVHLMPPFSNLASSARGRWTLDDGDAGSTEVRWEFAFELRSPLYWPVGQFLVWRFGGAMADCLEELDRRARIADDDVDQTVG